MQIHEYIEITHENDEERHRLERIIQDLHLQTEAVSANTVRTLIVHDLYSFAPLQDIQAAFRESGIKGSLDYWRRPEFDEQDWESAQFWKVALPDSPLPRESTDWIKCARCSRKKLLAQVPLPYRKPIRTAKQVFSFADGIDVVSRASREKIESMGLTGLRFEKFDAVGDYFTFRAATRLESQRLPKNEYEGDGTICDICGHRTGFLFGPYRFPRSEWNGDDFVALNGSPVFRYCTPRAYSVLQELDSSIWRAGIVVLE